MADNRGQFALAAGLDAQNAETVLLVVEGDALDQTRQHLARFQYITQNKLGSPVSLAYGEQGKYSLAEESTAALQKVPSPIKVRFVPVTEEAGIVSKAVPGEAKDLAERILQKRASMPGFLKRRERPLFRETKSLLRSL